MLLLSPPLHSEPRRSRNCRNCRMATTTRRSNLLLQVAAISQSISLASRKKGQKRSRFQFAPLKLQTQALLRWSKAPCLLQPVIRNGMIWQAALVTFVWLRNHQARFTAKLILTACYHRRSAQGGCRSFFMITVTGKGGTLHHRGPQVHRHPSQGDQNLDVSGFGEGEGCFPQNSRARGFHGIPEYL